MDAPRRMMAWHDINHDAEYIILAEMATSRPFRSLRVLAMNILRAVKLFVKFVRNLDLTNLTVLAGLPERSSTLATLFLGISTSPSQATNG